MTKLDHSSSIIQSKKGRGRISQKLNFAQKVEGTKYSNAILEHYVWRIFTPLPMREFSPFFSFFLVVATLNYRVFHTK